MRSILRFGIAVALSSGAAVALAADDKKEKDKPAPLPVTAKLIAKKKSYQLDLGGKTPEEYRKAIEEAKKTFRYPAPPEVDLTLELTNTSDKDVAIWSSGDPVQVSVRLIQPWVFLTQQLHNPPAGRRANLFPK